MKIQLLKENLHKAVVLANKFSASKTQLPVLSHLILESGEQGIFIRATDLELGFQMRIGGKVLEQGSVAVPAKLLADLANHLPLGAVELSSSDNMMLSVTAGKVKAKINGLPTEEFPDFPEDEGELLGNFELKKMLACADRIGFAVSTDVSRPILTGVKWEIRQGRMVATDGYRLSLVEAEFESEVALKQEKIVIASGRFLREALRVLADLGADKVRVSYIEERRQMHFKGADALIVGRVIEGDYPDYKTILPKGEGISLKLPRLAFLEAVRTAAIFAQDSANIIKLTVGKRTLSISANTPQIGENIVEMEVDAEGLDEPVAFNARYLVDFLSHAEKDEIVLELNGPLRPGLFKEEGDIKFWHVIMPVRVRGAE